MCLCMPESQYIIFAASKACNFMLSTWHCNHGYLQLDAEYRGFSRWDFYLDLWQSKPRKRPES